MRIRFEVAGKIVGINSTYARGPLRGGAKGLFVTAAAKEFKSRIGQHARVAMMKAHLQPIAHPCAVMIIVFNCRHDVDACSKICQDACEGIVFQNDSQVQEMHLYKMKDDKGPRMKVEVWKINEIGRNLCK